MNGSPQVVEDDGVGVFPFDPGPRLFGYGPLHRVFFPVDLKEDLLQNPFSDLRDVQDVFREPARIDLQHRAPCLNFGEACDQIVPRGVSRHRCGERLFVRGLGAGEQIGRDGSSIPPEPMPPDVGGPARPAVLDGRNGLAVVGEGIGVGDTVMGV